MRADILKTRKMWKAYRKRGFKGKEMPYEDFIQQLQQILSNELKKEKWEQNVNSIICENSINGTKEAERFKGIISEISRKISSIESYMRDLWADIYMGILRAEEDNDIEPNDLMKIGWESRACNHNINMESARKHYPLADYGDDRFPMGGIPGGCKEYHELMMQQKNIGFFDTDSEKESLKSYAFPQTYEIYQKLADSPVENLLLLEKTQGAGYTNQLFHYLKKVTDKKQLEKFEEIIIAVTDTPMFIRKDITDEIWRYLREFSYNDAAIQYVKNEIYGIACMIKRAYEKIWKYSWQKVEGFEAPIGSLKGILEWHLKNYFNWTEVNEDFIKRKGLLDVKNIEKAEECFIKYGEELVPINPIGEALTDKVLEMYEEKFEYQLDKNQKELREKMLEKALECLKEQEQGIWDRVDPRRKTEQLKPMDVYALIHVDIVKALNR